MRKLLKVIAIIVAILICWLLVSLGIVALFGGHVIQSRMDKYKQFTNMSEQEILMECGKAMKVTFPPNTHIIEVNEIRWLDTHVILKVEIDAKDLSAFLKTSPFSKIIFVRDGNVIYKNSVQPISKVTIEDVSVPIGANTYLDISIYSGKNEKVIIRLVY